MKQTNQLRSSLGFSLVEVMVGAAILLIAGLAVAHLMRGSSVQAADSLKACQDINEEILAGISALGSDGYILSYGVANNANYTSVFCDGCQAEYNLDPGLRWPASGPGRAALVESSGSLQGNYTVRPYLLKHSSLNFLSALYNSDESFCSSEGRSISSLADFHIFNGGTGAKNLLSQRDRFGDTRLIIQPVSKSGSPLGCLSGVRVRPSSHRGGDIPTALSAQLVRNEGNRARSDAGFHVRVVTTYEEPGGAARSCASEKAFYYSPEELSGLLSFDPPEETAPLLACDQHGLPYSFTTQVQKTKRDSVLMCRSRGTLATDWLNKTEGPCDPDNPHGPQCKCEEGYGCPNHWFEPPSLPAASLISPKTWFPCHRLNDVLRPYVENTVVSYSPAGRGLYEFDFQRIQLGYYLVVDVAEVDSAMNMTGDHAPTNPNVLTTLEVANRGVNPGTDDLPPGEICTDCTGEKFFGCNAAPELCNPGPCICTPTSCDCIDWAVDPCNDCPGNPMDQCACDGTTGTCGCPEFYDANTCFCDGTIGTCGCPDYVPSDPCECDPSLPECDEDADEDEDDEGGSGGFDCGDPTSSSNPLYAEFCE